jgi:hypothetical protein
MLQLFRPSPPPPPLPFATANVSPTLIALPPSTLNFVIPHNTSLSTAHVLTFQLHSKYSPPPPEKYMSNMVSYLKLCPLVLQYQLHFTQQIFNKCCIIFLGMTFPAYPTHFVVQSSLLWYQSLRWQEWDLVKCNLHHHLYFQQWMAVSNSNVWPLKLGS